MVEGNIPEPVKDKVGAELQRAKRASWDKLPEGVRKPKQFVQRTARRSSDALSSLMGGMASFKRPSMDSRKSGGAASEDEELENIEGKPTKFHHYLSAPLSFLGPNLHTPRFHLKPPPPPRAPKLVRT